MNNQHNPMSNLAEQLAARDAFATRVEKECRNLKTAIREIYQIIEPRKEIPATGEVAELLAKIDEICERSLNADASNPTRQESNTATL